MSLLQSLSRGYFRAGFRMASGLAYSVSLFIAVYVQPIATRAYNDRCAAQGVTFEAGLSASDIGLSAIAIAILLLLSRSNILVIGNLIISLIMVWSASKLFSTAGSAPFECFTRHGPYEDRTSGLEEFWFWLVAVILLSYFALLVDLLFWIIIKTAALWSSARSRQQNAIDRATE